MLRPASIDQQQPRDASIDQQQPRDISMIFFVGTVAIVVQHQMRMARAPSVPVSYLSRAKTAKTKQEQPTNKTTPWLRDPVILG